MITSILILQPWEHFNIAVILLGNICVILRATWAMNKNKYNK